MPHSELDFSDLTVLVTGAAGFIGANLALGLETRWPSCRVVALDDFTLGHFENLRGFRGECLAADVTRGADLDRLRRRQFDVIFHLAAVSDTRASDQRRVMEVNTNAFDGILDLAQSMQARVVYASSAAVYGHSPAPQRVGCGEEPANVYAFSKLMMERIAARWSDQAELPVVGLRYFNVYGPREEHKGPTSSMVLQLARQILEGGTARLFRAGQQRRDFVYIDDVVQATLLAAGTVRSGVYNVGSGEARTFNDVVQLLGRALALSPRIEYVDNPWPFYQEHTEAVIEPARRELGYEPRFTLEQGIAAYLPWLCQVCKTSGDPRCASHRTERLAA